MHTLPNSVFFTRHFEWIYHFLVWTFLIAERWINHASIADQPVMYGSYETITLLFTFILPIYLNAFVLIPKFLRKSKWFQYAILLIILILLVNVTKGLLVVFYFQFLFNEAYNVSDEFYKWAFRDYQSLDKFVFSPTSWILWISFAYRFVKDWFVYEHIKSKLVAEKVSMELALLKSQIDPHFLFNTLNNLYALALEEKAQRTADGVAKMGTLMRYNLHDSQADWIILEKEIDYIEKYIELQKLRLVEDSNVSIHTNLQMTDVKPVTIAPMILLPFIENAFKHGISMVQTVQISIELILTGNILQLQVGNTIHEKVTEDPGGIGLHNVQNRLRLLYPGRYKLVCTQSDGKYIVNLELQLTQ